MPEAVTAETRPSARRVSHARIPKTSDEARDLFRDAAERLVEWLEERHAAQNAPREEASR